MKQCPICDAEKKHERDLVCPICYQEYVIEAGKALAEGRIITPAAWAKPHMENRLEDLRIKLEKSQEAYKQLQENVRDEAYRAIKNALNGGWADDDVFKEALAQKKKTLWQEKGGNKLHYQIKAFEQNIAFIEGFLNGGKDQQPQLKLVQSASA